MEASGKYDDFELYVRGKLAELTGYSCKKQFEVGQSGNRWQVDCVLLDDNNLRKGYVEVKETSIASKQSTYINHMRRAYAEMGDFRQMNVPKAVIVAEKREFGRMDWDAMLEFIDCLLVDIDKIDRFIAEFDF